MPVTVIGPQSQPRTGRVHPPIVEVKENWEDDWQFEPRLELVRARTVSAAQDLDTCELRHVYGKLKHPWEGGITSQSSWGTLWGYWVRVMLAGDQGLQQAWIGRISSESRDVTGSTAHGPSGRQILVAYGPADILRKIYVGRSFWWADAQEMELGWVPSMNDRDGHNSLIGNRSLEKHDGTFLYDTDYISDGGKIWTHYDYAEYALRRLVDQGDADGPKWSLGGDAELLRNLEEVVSMGITQTAADVLAALINPRWGMDYTIVPTGEEDDDPADKGFEVFVYALSAREQAFGGEKLPKNPNLVRVQSSQTTDSLRTTVVTSGDQRFGRVRVVGRRIVVCGSVFGSAIADDLEAGYGLTIPNRLTPKWKDALEDAYKAGTGNPFDPGSQHDEARRNEKFRAVYAQYGQVPDVGWEAPVLDAAGELAVPHDWNDQYQVAARSTLSWLPLREGFDYSADPAVDNNPADHHADLLPPIVWLFWTGWWPGVHLIAPWFTKAEELGIHVSVPRSDWGVFLSAGPNHLMALNDWAGAADSESEPVFDHEMMVATIAAESDHRLVLEQEIPGAEPSDGVMEIEVPDAEFWCISPWTVVGVDSSGDLVFSGDKTRVLRNDASRLAFVMAGAISRYLIERARASITIAGLKPWGNLIGQILTSLEQAGDAQQVHAPITSVEWTAGRNDDPGTTVIGTGFAL